jgi:hypothetical protein
MKTAQPFYTFAKYEPLDIFRNNKTSTSEDSSRELITLVHT